MVQPKSTPNRAFNRETRFDLQRPAPKLRCVFNFGAKNAETNQTAIRLPSVSIEPEFKCRRRCEEYALTKKKKRMCNYNYRRSLSLERIALKLHKQEYRVVFLNSLFECEPKNKIEK